MIPEKLKKGYLSRSFRGAFLAGLTAMTLATGMISTAYAQTEDPPQPPSTSTVSVESLKPWQQGQDYKRDMQIVLVDYEKNINSLRAQTEERIVRINTQKNENITDPWFRGGNINIITILQRQNTLIKRASAAIDREKANEAKQSVNLEKQYVREQKSIEDRYQKDYERKNAPQSKVAVTAANTAKSFEQQKMDICQRRVLQVLASGRDLPAGDACRVVLDAQPKL